MEFKDVLAISGQPGLYKFVAQGSNGIIIEALADNKRSNIPASSKVSALAEIAIYTESDDMPLGDIFQSMFAVTEGKEAISHKSSSEQLKEFFAKAVPTYDRDRVHVSDMKKAIAWFNILVGAGMTEFATSEEEEAVEE